MSKDRQEKRNKIKPFIKVINYNHLMPTRYTLELEGLKGVVSADTFKEVSQREDAKKTVKKVFEERYTSGKNRWFFTALSTSYLVLDFGADTPSSLDTRSLVGCRDVGEAVGVVEESREYGTNNLSYHRILSVFLYLGWGVGLAC
jgi:hypothetical protein